MATSIHTRKRPELHRARNRCEWFENCDVLAEHLVKSRVPAPKVTLSLAVAAAVVAICSKMRKSARFRVPMGSPHCLSR
jgi:hypothetical protein